VLKVRAIFFSSALTAVAIRGMTFSFNQQVVKKPADMQPSISTSKQHSCLG